MYRRGVRQHKIDGRLRSRYPIAADVELVWLTAANPLRTLAMDAGVGGNLSQRSAATAGNDPKMGCKAIRNIRILLIQLQRASVGSVRFCRAATLPPHTPDPLRRRTQSSAHP
jgi:hypothetical protein